MKISIYNNAPTFIRHAVGKLSKYTGIMEGINKEGDPGIRVEIDKMSFPKIGRQGYIIQSINRSNIIIKGNHDEGIANGIFTMIRTLMIKNIEDPFRLNWKIKEEPRFSVRNINIAPYRFGGSFGYAVLSPDRWSIKEWMEYIDLLRLCNMSSITINTASRIYHPDYSQTLREKWRYDVWLEVKDYCHQVGIKCNLFIAHGATPQEIYWNNPELRATGQEAGGYYGCGLMWRKAKNMILDVYRYMFEHLRGIDGLEMIYSEAGFSFDDKTSADPAGYFADVTESYRNLLEETGNSGEYFFWNWVFDLWTEVVLPESLLKKHPKYRTLLDDLIPLLPKDIGWIDASMLSIIQMFGPEIKARGNPPLREGLLLGKEKGFSPIINCFWYMNPEYALNMLPHPYIKRAIQEARYSVDELKPDGVAGYRLAPPCRFLGDYTFFRLASDPSLSQQQLVDEMAGILCKKEENRETVRKAIDLLEEFWTTHDEKTIKKVEESFANAFSGEKSKTLQYISNGTTFLSFIVRLAQPGISDKKKNELRKELYVRLKSMYIFQGITSDITWQPESYAMFSFKVDLMIKQYDWYRSSRPDFVDRNIYSEAMSKPYRLKWKAESNRREKDDRGIGEMPGALTID